MESTETMCREIKNSVFVFAMPILVISLVVLEKNRRENEVFDHTVINRIDWDDHAFDGDAYLKDRWFAYNCDKDVIFCDKMLFVLKSKDKSLAKLQLAEIQKRNWNLVIEPSQMYEWQKNFVPDETCDGIKYEVVEELRKMNETCAEAKLLAKPPL